MERLNRISFALLNTSHAGNIGAAARAMKVMGMSDLRLMTPNDYPSAEATARASGADDVLYHATVVENVDQAIADSTLVMGTSARTRGMDIPVIGMREAAELLTQHAVKGRASLLFGKERYGMTNEEMQRCHYLVNFPANPEYSSLNLASAVQLAAYELRMQCLLTQDVVDVEKEDVPFATMEKMDSFYQHLFGVLARVEFMKGENSKSLEEKFRMMFNRLRIERHEMDILRGMLSAINKNLPSEKK
ncbi:RNA methyltransferase [Marinicella rhabdoformis]|uniref:RNA methyltransferase n=1 Tax=Marinicella rhabdoformis TaxID=2580566 RepID=UPI0012AEC7EB|nr:RNA methyltransferase [Marinicella rhabdoformis]